VPQQPQQHGYGAGQGYGGSGGGGYRQNAPVVREEPVAHVTPIVALNPYQNKWTIKARYDTVAGFSVGLRTHPLIILPWSRVTNKSDIRRWSNARGEDHLCC
jgi:hypothetical protein